MDILFSTNDYIFSYRIAGIYVKDNKVLLQKPTNSNGYSFVGGHIEFLETHEEALKREFKEELGVNIEVKDLKWIGEIFFDWGNKRCHQICFYYEIDISDNFDINNLSTTSIFDNTKVDINFYLIDIDVIDKVEVHPKEVVPLIKDKKSGIIKFISKN